MAKNILFENCKKIINHYLSKEDKISWGKEIKIAQKLLKDYPKIEFWTNHYDPQTKLKSLSVFLTKPAKIDLDREYSLFLLTQEKESIALEDKPVVEIEYSKNNKPRSLKEFIDN